MLSAFKTSASSFRLELHIFVDPNCRFNKRRYYRAIRSPLRDGHPYHQSYLAAPDRRSPAHARARWPRPACCPARPVEPSPGQVPQRAQVRIKRCRRCLLLSVRRRACYTKPLWQGFSADLFETFSHSTSHKQIWHDLTKQAASPSPPRWFRTGCVQRSSRALAHSFQTPRRLCRI